MSSRYLNSLLSLMPEGLFNFKESVNLRNFLTGFAEEFQRVEDFIKESFDNLFPKNSDESFLRKWANLTGQTGVTTALLRERVLRQLRKSGGATISSFTSHFEDLGLDADADRVLPVIRPYNCNSNCNGTVWTSDLTNVFGLRLPINQQIFNCNSKCDAPLVQNQTDEVLDYLRGAAPAHAEVYFFYR